MRHYSIDDVRQALQTQAFDGLQAQQKMIPVPRIERRPPERPGQVRVGAVLLMLYPHDGHPVGKTNGLHLVLTRRPDTLRSHAGQISLPGGRREVGETLVQAALRETWEEIGVAPESLELLGELSPLYIPPSDFEVHPFVAWRTERPSFRLSPREVAEIIETPLAHLADPATRVEEQWELRGATVVVPYFNVAGHKVWGATAMILSEFVERLRGERA